MARFLKLFTVFFLLSLISFSQISKVHYIPPLTANDRGQGGGGSIPYDQYLYLSTPSTSDVSVKITVIKTGQEITYTDLRNDNPIVYQIASLQSPMNGELFVDPDNTGEPTLNAGLVVEADCPVYASVRYNAGAQAGALVSKGDASLGTHFRTGMMTTGSQTDENVAQYGTNSHNLNFISVMATEDNTTIRIDLPHASPTVEIKGYNYTGNAIVKVLNKHQSMIIATDAREQNNQGGNRFALVGALVRSIDDSGTIVVEDPTKPIVVNVGSASGTFAPSGGGHDHGVDQIVGLDRIGHEYIFVKGNGAGGELETPLVVAAENGTLIYINADTNPIAQLDAGEYYVIPPQNYSGTNQGATMYVRTQDKNHPVFAYQGVGGSGDSEANQGMFFVPPLSNEANDDVNNIPQIDFIGTTQYNTQSGVTIVTNSNATITINDGNGDYDINSLTPVTVTGKSEYKAYSITDLVGNVKVSSTGELYLAYFNTLSAATSGGFYAGFNSPPKAEIDLGINSLGNCLQIDDDGNITDSNITLQITNSEGFDSWIWEISKDEGQTWNAALGTSTDVETYVPTEPGDYRLKGIISCLDNFNQYSGIIPVSICPSDSDGDGIIDNLDLDLDNDGILNSIESAGNLTLDLSSINNPVFSDKDGNSVNVSVEIKTEGTDESNTITGADNGDINFSMAASSSATLSYEIKNTSEPLNYKFTGNSETITAGDYFEIRVFPNTRNITLLDPNDELVIDSNFDGQTFDEGKQIVTGSVIRFKYKQNTANPTFEFLAYDVDGLKITSGADGTTSVSDFSGKIEIIDYKINSDENSASTDSVYDYYDLESDGDECFDLTEAGFTYEGFIGDPDNDGILGTSPLNTNTAGVIDDRGRVIEHKDAGGYEIEPKKDSNGNYLFQTPGEPVEIQTQPQSTNGCEGSSAEFEISASSETTITYQWQFFNTTNNDWENLNDDSNFSGTTTSKLLVSNISSSMDGRYRVLLSDQEYLCEIGSDPNVNLTVNLAPDNPIVNQIQTYCQTDTPTIANLVATNNNATLTLNWYESEDATTPLDSSVELTHNTFYYAEFIDEEGCVSVSRTPSKAFISNPLLSASNEVICSGEGFTLTIDNVAKTASDFAAENELIFITNNGVPVTWNSSTYGNTYFMIQAGTGQAGFSPIDWPDAKAITDGYNSGDSNSSARMYIPKNADMEKAVHDGLVSMGLTGNNGIAFWLGLYQDLDENDAEPGNESQNWGGWKWVNGEYLRDTYRNWRTVKDEGGNDVAIEPNNWNGIEHHAQFEFDNYGIQWNDMSVGNENGKSWPLFEYSGASEIVWGYYNADGSEEIISDITTTSYEVESLTETRTYFVKVTTNGVECVTEKTITVNPNPTAEVIPDYEFCDNTDDDDGNNGSITFTKADFDALIPSILGAEQAVSDYTVTFYTSSDDASTSNSAITFPYTNPEKPATDPHWGVNITEIFVRVENNTTACFNADTKFNLVVKPKPIFYGVDDIILCDDDRDGIVGGFDLTLRSDNLRSGDETTDPNNEDNQSRDDFTITYHTSLDDANNLESTGIENPENFTIEQANNQTIYFRIVKTGGSDPSGCFVTGEAFDLVVQPLPVANDVTIDRQCDGDSELDTDSQDGIYPFDTSNIQTTLLAGQTDVTTYYYTKDADDNDVLIGNELPNPFESGSQIITIQVVNNTPESCYDETTLEFIVDDTPETYAVVIDSKCDDGPSDIDGYSEFDTSTITQTLLTNPETNQTQSLDLYSVVYKYIDVNGNTVEAAELPNPFNTITQTVEATVTNKLNPECVASENIQFTVDPLPVIKENLIIIEQCDDGKGDENDGITLHDLTESQLLLSDNYENEIFEYYKDSSFSTPIENPSAYENYPFYDEVWIKIISEDGCERNSKTQGGDDRLKIEITVGASEISETFMQDENTFYTVCDDSPANNQDGISIFSSDVLKEVREKLIASNPKFDDQNIRVTLHVNSEDGLTGQNPINLEENFSNVTPNTQEIWARVVNIDITKFTCLGYAQVAELYVEPRPVAYPVTIERQCDGDSELDTDSQDGIYPFDTTNIIPTLLTNPDTGVIQDESILTITYFNEDGTEIPAASFSPNFATASQTITIRVERDPSYPNIENPDGLCYDETTLEFIVDDTPELYPVVFAPHCDGDDGNDDRDGFDEFDTSTLTADLIGPDQSLDDYEISFLYTDEDGNLLTAPELRNPFNTKTQTVVVTLVNKINTTCPATYDLEFVVNPLPEFTVDDTKIVCLNLPPIPIGVVSAEAEYTYTWTHTNNDGVNNVFAPNNPDSDDNSSILVGEGGTYYVTATTTDGTDCSRTLSIEVEESEIATVTLDDITVQDLTSDNNNTITIDTSNLGLGDYEFAIDDPNGPYQNDPFFENVRPGIHTIYIRDRNDCGIAQIDVSVIGYKKFFTPNGDGIHDTWRILGIREDFQPNSRVYIFDRYGKLLKELDPITQGWDGTYLGRPMPQTDYWFRVFLEDGREFNGHFSLVRGRNGGNN